MALESLTVCFVDKTTLNLNATHKNKEENIEEYIHHLGLGKEILKGSKKPNLLKK